MITVNLRCPRCQEPVSRMDIDRPDIVGCDPCNKWWKYDVKYEEVKP